ncbi:hypothetical protein FWK35_00034229 [Aphis craccivora]|uniref:Uncharacterized protein n=1 Tax=Aphis craccivora TaxID=307492 RepID=A0A6G0VLB9_APHCR|nr:hypothetical protein FWK35_00034229 [Aphis craccivora]
MLLMKIEPNINELLAKHQPRPSISLRYFFLICTYTLYIYIYKQ